MLMYLVSFVCACVEPLSVSEGWLQYETMVQIQIHPTKQQPISMQHKGPIKLSFQQQQQDDSGHLLDVQPMRVKVGGGIEHYNNSCYNTLLAEKDTEVPVVKYFV